MRYKEASDDTKREVLNRLLENKTHRQICDDIGIHPNTLHSWLMYDEEFKAEYDRIIEVNYEAAIDGMTQRARDIGEELVDIAINGEIKDRKDRLEAIKLFFNILQRRKNIINGVELKMNFD